MIVTTIKTGNERLLRLAEFLEELPAARFDYNHWVGSDWGGAKDLSCGTTACALGWATAIPEFQALGLHLVKDEEEGESFVVLGDVAISRCHWGTSFASAEALFSLNRNEAEWLFLPETANDDGEEGPVQDASAKEVAAHIRAFVASRQ